MFRAALAHANIAPEHSVHVGDHLIDDIEGAAAVGMHTLWVNFSGQPPNSSVAPSAEVARLAELPQAISELSRGVS